MGKASWNDALVSRPYKPSMLTNRIPGRKKRPVTASGVAIPMGHVTLPAVQRPFREPQKLDTDGVRWFAVRAVHAGERALQDELEGIRYRVYCPLVTKWAWKHGYRSKDKRQTPVFARYVFVGCAPTQEISRHTVEGIEAVLGDGCGDRTTALREGKGLLEIPPLALRFINELELAGEWDETRGWNEKTPFQPGRLVRIAQGAGIAFAGLSGVVDVALSEERIRVLISLFNQSTPVDIDACNLEPV